MARILAIEPDAERGTTLRRLVCESLDADVVLATSTEAAIAAMAEDPPDLILTSSLLPPDDDQQLAAHLRQAPALRHLQILTIPPLVGEDQASGSGVRGLVSRLTRRRSPAWPAYDFDALAARIRETIEESKAKAAADQPAPAQIVEAPGEVLQLSDEELRAYCGLGSRRKRAPRWTGADLPWISTIKLSWGLELRLLNISSSGLLVESGIRLTPGSRTAFQLGGPNKDLLVPARVVRSRVSTVDPLGVRYQAAAEFEHAFDALTPADPSPAKPDDPADHLAELVARVREGAATGGNPADLRAEFEAGVHELVSAREIRLREAPLVENDGRDSVYFTVPTYDDSPAILQVTFEPHYRPCHEEFAALRAAAVAAADVLQYTETARHMSLALA